MKCVRLLMLSFALFAVACGRRMEDAGESNDQNEEPMQEPKPQSTMAMGPNDDKATYEKWKNAKILFSETQEDNPENEKGKVVVAPRNEAEKVAEQNAELHAQFFEGDIKLSKDQENDLEEFRNARKAKKETITGNGRAFIGKKWPNARVPYVLSGRFGQSRKKTVEAAIKLYNEKTCIRFVPKRSTDKYWVEFIVDGGLCYSHFGKVNKEGQPISIGNGCNYVGTVIHEMMHCIGFFHEQSRRDRDDHIDILWNNIDTRRYGKDINFQFEKYQQGEGDTLGQPYDLDSIMHYPNTAFGKRDSRGKLMTTIRAKSNPSKVLGERQGFSEGDLTQINMMYNCKNFLKKQSS